ncbi:MAG: hypoxanthine phosphoribosyltransferase [Bacteroidetes bacterium 47-18]|nr:MAG: hypoxanthine phosphoribosyltransferase [Bacteroidetes bacterium 47-18]
MKAIQVLDKAFVPFITASEIDRKIQEIADRINKAYSDKNPLFIAVLNGSFMFASDLFKKITIPAQISFIKLASYKGTTSTGNVITAIGLDESLKDRHIILLEDIIDTGKTLSEFLPQLWNQAPASLKIAALLTKPEALRHEVHADYTGFEIENRFVLGYGLDYDGYGRNLPELYQLKP